MIRLSRLAGRKAIPMALSLDTEFRVTLERSMPAQILACVYLSILMTGSILLATRFLAHLILH